MVYEISDEGDLIAVNNCTDFGNLKLDEQDSAEDTVPSDLATEPKASKESPPSDAKKVISPNIPSPFKKALFWPSNIKNIKKRKAKEKVPTVYTSDKWQEYYIKKEAKKQKIEDEKELKKAERLKNKLLKEEELKIKKQIKKEKIEKKKKEKMIKSKKD